MIFIDCEFTNFAHPKLLSIGLVCDDGAEFYSELNLADPASKFVVAEASQFVHEVVLPQWGAVKGAAMSYAVMAHEVQAWLAARLGRLEIHYDSSVDYTLLESLLEGQQATSSLELVPTHIGYLAQDPDGCAAAAASWADSKQQGLLQHHALADACALMARFFAVHGWPIDPQDAAQVADPDD